MMNVSIPMDVMRAQAEGMAGRLRLMSHPERLLMLCRMADGEVSVGSLVEMTGLSQSLVSQHLAKLREAGIVEVRAEAQSRYYVLVDEAVRAIIDALCTISERQAGRAQAGNA